jgi:hypothetical protein
MHKFGLLLAFFAILTGARAQEDNIVVDKKLLVNGVPLGAGKTAVVKAMGKPQRITKFESDDNEDRWLEYHYGRNILQVLYDGKLYGFNLKSAGVTIKYEDCVVKVGDPLTVLEKCFPVSYRDYVKTGDKIFRIIFNGTDAWLLMHVDKGKVVGIETWADL